VAGPNIYGSGAGGTTGDEIAVNVPVYVLSAGHIWYVQSTTGTDAAGRGKERERPLATLGQAIANSSGGDVIILMLGHAETVTGALAPGGKTLTIVGEGSGSSRPRLTCGAAIAMITLASPGTSLNNIYFPASITIAPTVRVDVVGTGIVMDNCYFECGALDTNRTLRYATAATACQLTNAYFLATASQPAVAIEVAVTVPGLFMEEVTLDGGSFGFSDFAFKGNSVVQGIYANKIHQLNNADVIIASGSSGVWVPGVQSGSARIESA
jgi:hypothetical protein